MTSCPKSQPTVTVEAIATSSTASTTVVPVCGS
ncbi:hypothetical protein FHR78_001954 [Frigoribacterium faeni]|nr:hypothetical protein [Frigoribacterium faeni]